MIALCLCNNWTLDGRPLKKKLAAPLVYFLWNFHWKLFGAHGLEVRVVSPEEGDCYFYTKSITALSKLSFERLPAMCWT